MNWRDVTPKPKTPEQRQRSLEQKKRRQVGRRVEAIVEHRLRYLGLEMVERINVETRRVRGKTLYAKKVAGDFRAVTPGGIAVLVEVKHRDADRLAFNDIEPHQRAALNRYRELQAWALLVWARRGEFCIVHWGNVREGLSKPGASLSWETFSDCALIGRCFPPFSER